MCMGRIRRWMIWSPGPRTTGLHGTSSTTFLLRASQPVVVLNRNPSTLRVERATFFKWQAIFSD